VNTPKAESLVTMSKQDITPDMSSFSDRVNHFMRTSNPCNFVISDWEVVERYRHLGKLQNMLEKNGTIEMTKEEKK